MCAKSMEMRNVLWFNFMPISKFWFVFVPKWVFVWNWLTNENLFPLHDHLHADQTHFHMKRHRLGKPAARAAWRHKLFWHRDKPELGKGLFYFPFFSNALPYITISKNKQNKISAKDKIEPPHMHCWLMVLSYWMFPVRVE